MQSSSGELLDIAVGRVLMLCVVDGSAGASPCIPAPFVQGITVDSSRFVITPPDFNFNQQQNLLQSNIGNILYILFIIFCFD